MNAGVVFLSIIALFLYFSCFNLKIPGFYSRATKILFVAGCFVLVNGILQSAYRYPIESLLPTLNRVLLVFCFYILGRALAFYYVGEIKVLDFFVTFWIFFLFLVSILQFLFFDMVYKNGAYRLSSIYGEYSTGLALFVSLLFIFSFYRFISGERLYVILMAMCLIMLLGTQSRISVISVFLSIFLSGFLLIRKVGDAIKYSIFAIFSCLFLYIIIFHTSLAVRLKHSFSSGLQDNSVLNRYAAWSDAIQNMTTLEYFTGVGLGGFNLHYFSASGKLGMAAHNDYVQIFVELGIFALVSYLFLQLYLIARLRKFALRDNIFASLGLAVLFNNFIFASLHNPFYYFESLCLASFMIGLCIQNNKILLERESYGL